MAQPDGAPKRSSAAGGWGALKSCGKHLLGSRAPLSGARALLKANQPDGFDCPGCAWGDPEHGSSFEFCENGVKAVSWEATDKRTKPSFFARHTLTELRTWSDFALEGEGRLTHPMRYDAASDRYLPVSWDEAFAEIGATLRGLDHPDQAEFYTSGRASNEAAYLYQLFARAYGTNNFPDCSNMCHEASGVALIDAIGIGKGTVLLEDFEKADAIFCVGQNPGTNHPRMLGDLRRAAERGAKVVVLNPVRERGLERFADPQNTVEMLRGSSQPIASHYLQPRSGGDMAAFRGIAKIVFARDEEALASGRPSLLDRAFLEHHTAGLDAYRAAVEATSWGRDPRPVGPDLRRHLRHGGCLSRRPAGDRHLGHGREPSTATRWRPCARSPTCCSCAAISAGPVPPVPRCAAIPTCRATARSASTSAPRWPSSNRWSGISASPCRASTATTSWRRSGRCATARRRRSSVWAATSCGRRRIPRWWPRRSPPAA